jgi:hypothetical protein
MDVYWRRVYVQAVVSDLACQLRMRSMMIIVTRRQKDGIV